MDALNEDVADGNDQLTLFADAELDGAVPDGPDSATPGVLRKPTDLDSVPPLIGEAGAVKVIDCSTMNLSFRLESAKRR